MSKRKKCLLCDRMIGTGCGCCRDDFPEETGYCYACYPKSRLYQDTMQSLRGLMDCLRTDDLAKLKLFIKDYDEDHYDFYLKEIDIEVYQKGI